MAVEQAEFRRLGYSGEETFAEVELRSNEWKRPLLATFKQRPDGALSLVSVTEKREDPELDWYENNLHEAFPNVEETLFGERASERAAFEKEVLACGNIRETIEDKLYYGE